MKREKLHCGGWTAPGLWRTWVLSARCSEMLGAGAGGWQILILPGLQLDFRSSL